MNAVGVLLKIAFSLIFFGLFVDSSAEAYWAFEMYEYKKGIKFVFICCAILSLVLFMWFLV